MPLSLHDGSAWRQAKELHFNDGAAWRKAKEVWVRDDSAWRKVFTGGEPALTYKSISSSGSFSTVTALFSVMRDGRLLVRNSSGDFYPPGEWWTSGQTAGVGDAYEVRVTRTGGANPTGPGLGAWLALTQDRSWFIERDTDGSTLSSVTVEIRLAGGAVLASAAFDLEAVRGNL